MFENDSKTFKTLNVFITVIACMIAFAGAIKGFATAVKSETTMVNFYLLLNFMPATWLIWFFISKNATKSGKANMLALIPTIVSALCWIIGAIDLFEDEEIVFPLLLLLILFLADGVWEILKPTKAGTKLNLGLSIGLFFGTFVAYSYFKSSVLGIFGMLDEEGLSIGMSTNAFYALVFFFGSNLILSVAKHIANIDAKLQENTSTVKPVDSVTVPVDSVVAPAEPAAPPVKTTNTVVETPAKDNE